MKWLKKEPKKRPTKYVKTKFAFFPVLLCSGVYIWWEKYKAVYVSEREIRFNGFAPWQHGHYHVWVWNIKCRFQTVKELKDYMRKRYVKVEDSFGYHMRHLLDEQ